MSRITKDQLTGIGFSPWHDKTEKIWSFDGDRIMYDIKEQALYDADEVHGNHEKLCVVKDIDELKELVYSYFKVDVDSPEENY